MKILVPALICLGVASGAAQDGSVPVSGEVRGGKAMPANEAAEKKAPRNDRIKYLLLSREILLEKYYLDKDGVLNEEEKKALLKDADKAHQEAQKHFMKRFDKDNDGKLSEQEAEEMKKFLQRERSPKRPEQGPEGGQAASPAPPDARPMEGARRGVVRHLGRKSYRVRPSVFLLMQSLIIERYDKNRNGMLEPEEYALLDQEAEALFTVKKQELLARYDANKDGVLDDNEKAKAKAGHAAGEDDAAGLEDLKFDDIDLFIRNSFEEELMQLLDEEAEAAEENGEGK